MDLLRIQDTLKNASDQQLVQMMQTPDSSAPSYLVLSELRRRKDMRDKAVPQEGSSGTVAEELTQQATPAEPMGLHSLRTPVEEEPVEPQAYREGGIVRMQEGGQVPAGIESLANPERIPSFADIYARNEGLIPDTTGELRQRLQQDRVDPAARRNEALNMALIDAGLRIASSRNPSLLGAIGEGAAPAVQGYTQQLGQVRQEQRQARQDELELAKQDASRRFAIGQLTANEYRGIVQDINAERRARQQMAAAAASAGRADAAADRRLERQSTLQREELQRRGYYTPQEFAALTPEQQASVREMRGMGRPADVSGIAPVLNRLERQYDTTLQALDALGPEPSRTRGMFGSENPAFAEYQRQSQTLRERLAEIERRRREYEGVLMGGRGRQPQGGAGGGEWSRLSDLPLEQGPNGVLRYIPRN